ncbi:MAG: YdbC family protein [Treponema sp.]|nr:YdbC family protein [Candidatus Treponema caballi]
MADDFSFEIEKTMGVFSTNKKSGWTSELNLISWGGRPAKYDIRAWSPDHQKMGKGVTLTAEELAELKKLLNETEL